jgi:hypothetical protein
VIILVVSMCSFYPRLDLILEWIGYPKDLSEMTRLALWAMSPYVILVC